MESMQEMEFCNIKEPKRKLGRAENMLKMTYDFFWTNLDEYVPIQWS